MSHLVFISSKDFNEMSKQFPNDFVSFPRVRITILIPSPSPVLQHKFCEMRDQMEFGVNKFNTRCFSCKGKYGHSIKDCPFMHYTRNKLQLIRRFNFSQPHKERKPLTRSERRYFNSRLQRKLVKRKLKKFRDKVNERFTFHDGNLSDFSQDDDWQEQRELDKDYFQRQSLHFRYFPSAKEILLYRGRNVELVVQDIEREI